MKRIPIEEVGPKSLQTMLKFSETWLFAGFFMHEHIFFRTLSPRNSKYKTLFKSHSFLGF